MKEEKWKERSQQHLSRTKGSPKCKQLERSSKLRTHSHTGKKNSEGGITVPSEDLDSFYLFTVSPLQSSAETLVIHQVFNLGALFPIGF